MVCNAFKARMRIRSKGNRWRSAASVLAVLAAMFAAVTVLVPRAQAAAPIGIAVIAPTEQIDGKAIVQGAELAVHEINAHGGVDGRQLKLYKFEDHFSATSAVRAWQKAVQQDHVVAGVGVFASEVALALEPWVGRLHVPFIDTGSASPKITGEVHKNYRQLKYMFLDNLNGTQLAELVCRSLHDTVFAGRHGDSAVIMAENADWTKSVVREYQRCLPKEGLKVAKTIRFSPSTSDFTPTYNTIEGLKPQVVVTAIAHVGLRPTVQWEQGRVPALLAGVNAQATASTFWNKSNGDTQGVISMNSGSVNGAAVTPKTPAFYKAYTKRFGGTPAYSGYNTYDAVHMIAKAIEKSGSTNADAMVHQLESLNYEGVGGRYQFYGKASPNAHGVKFGPKYVSGIAFQWQNGKQVAIWPKRLAQGQVILPSFVKPAFK